MLLDGVDVVQEVVDTATKLTAVNGSLATLEQLLADQLVNVYTSMYSQKSVLKKDYGDRIKAVTDNLVVEGGNVESLQVKMTTANGQISTLEGDVATLRTNVGTLNTNGNTHTAGLKATNVEVAALKALQTKDAATMAKLLKVMSPSKPDEAPVVAAISIDQATLTFAAQAAPSVKYTFMMSLNGNEQGGKTKVDNMACDGSKCTATATWPDHNVGGKLTWVVTATNDIAAVVYKVSNALEKDTVMKKYSKCTCDSVKDQASGYFTFECGAITFENKPVKYTTYCDNDADGGGWTLVSRIDGGSSTHGLSRGVGKGADGFDGPGTLPSIKCMGYDINTNPYRTSARPNICGKTWKLPDKVINQLATYGKHADAAFKFDCGAWTSYYQFQQHSENKADGGTTNGFFADKVSHSDNLDKYRYRRMPDDDWTSGWSTGAGSGGSYAYLAFDNDHREESLGWSAYGMQYAQHGWGVDGCLGVSQHAPRVGLGSGYNGALWMKRGFD